MTKTQRRADLRLGIVIDIRIPDQLNIELYNVDMYATRLLQVIIAHKVTRIVSSCVYVYGSAHKDACVPWDLEPFVQQSSSLTGFLCLFFSLSLSLFVLHLLLILTCFFFFFFSISVNGAGWCDDVNEADAPEWAESSSSGNSASLIADADFEVMPTEVRVASGTTAYLSCRPRSLRNKTVISSRWMVCKSMSLFAPRPYYCVCYLNGSVNTS